MQAPKVLTLDRLLLQYRQQPWPFAAERRVEIEAHFEHARRDRPGIWNGQVLVMHRHRFDRDTLEGAFLQTDFASFMTWRDWGFPEAGVTNCFSMGALRTSDVAWIMGVMAPHTSAGGKIYFPAGTPDPGDVVDGVVDLAGSVTREVAEETGLGAGDVLRRRILEHLARETTPELADIRIVRSHRDFDPMIPRFVTAFLDHTGFPQYTRS